MTDEHAMKVWLYSSGYEGNADVEQAVREFAAVIAADRAGLVARVAELEKLLENFARMFGEPIKSEARAALKDTRHD